MFKNVPCPPPALGSGEIAGRYAPSQERAAKQDDAAHGSGAATGAFIGYEVGGLEGALLGGIAGDLLD